MSLGKVKHRVSLSRTHVKAGHNPEDGDDDRKSGNDDAGSLEAREQSPV